MEIFGGGKGNKLLAYLCKECYDKLQRLDHNKSIMQVEKSKYNFTKVKKCLFIKDKKYANTNKWR